MPDEPDTTVLNPSPPAGTGPEGEQQPTLADVTRLQNALQKERADHAATQKALKDTSDKYASEEEKKLQEIVQRTRLEVRNSFEPELIRANVLSAAALKGFKNPNAASKLIEQSGILNDDGSVNFSVIEERLVALSTEMPELLSATAVTPGAPAAIPGAGVGLNASGGKNTAAQKSEFAKYEADRAARRQRPAFK
jgi:hypothetical protein